MIFQLVKPRDDVKKIKSLNIHYERGNKNNFLIDANL